MTPNWLGLNEAAKRLGIHPTTLRRWADTGEIPVMITPGGHRRFDASQLDRFATEHQRLRIVVGIEQVLAERILAQTRQELDNRRGEPWMSVYDDAQREHKRLLGRQLMTILLQYISLKEGGAELLEKARAIGHEHAESSLNLEMPLMDTLKVVLFFRDMIFEVVMQLPEIAQSKAETNAPLFRRISTLLSVIELAVAETYDRAANPEQSQPREDLLDR